MAAKAKMRTSEDVFNRLRWDEGMEAGVIVGYEDRLEGPVEVPFKAFIPISEGGCVPFHRVFYFRREEDVLWDRRRRFDAVFGSGDTSLILGTRNSKTFDAAADHALQTETKAIIEQAKATMLRLEEERMEALEKRQHAKTRKDKDKLRCPEGQVLDLKELEVHCQGASYDVNKDHLEKISVATWNLLFDDFIEDEALRSSVRGPRIAKVLTAASADIVALQEVTDDSFAALLAALPEPFFWTRSHAGGLAVLSRWPLQASELRLGPRKRALLVEFSVNGQAIALANVHFSSDRKGGEMVDRSNDRLRQASIVRSALSTCMPSAVAIVCGDFNEPCAQGCELAATKGMEGMLDAWTVVHGASDTHPGHSFAPLQNCLAKVSALITEPRRLDRIFTSRHLEPLNAVLFATDGSDKVETCLSDHFGLLVDLRVKSPLSSVPCHRSAAVVLPPEELWLQIDAIRQRCDPSFGRWMPHINILYGFLAEDCFAAATVVAEKVVRRFGAFTVHLDEFDVFEHGRTASLVLSVRTVPQAALESLQQELELVFPTCIEQSRHRNGYRSHMTLGRFDSAAEARRLCAELADSWQPLSFVAESVAFISRDEGPFSCKVEIPFPPVQIVAAEEAILKVMESATGSRAFSVGSSFLLGHEKPTDSDLDVLLVGSCSSDAAFKALTELPEVAWARKAEGAGFQLLQMDFNGSKVDVQYARCALLQHPTRWDRAVCAEGYTAAAALRDAYSIYHALVEKGGMGTWHRYQRALKDLRAWTKLRGICCNSVGFLGGFAWALLLADTVLCDESEEDDLVVAVGRRFLAWPWPQPSCLHLCSRPATAEAAVRAMGTGGLMPVICPTDPWADAARNVTAETFAQLLREFELMAVSKNLPMPISPLEEFPFFIVCEARAPSLTLHATCSSELEARVLALIRSLRGVPLRPLKQRPGLIIVGVQTTAERAHEAASDFRRLLGRCDETWCSHIDVDVQVQA